MSALGSEQRPVIVKVTSQQRMEKVTELCAKNNLHFIAGLESEENLTDLKLALKEKAAPNSVYDPCPCGSGTKYRFCCMKKEFKLSL